MPDQSTPPLTKATDPLRIIFCGGALIAAPVAAHAYLDPGSGSLIFQSLLAVVFGIGVGLRSVRAWLRSRWTWLRQRVGTDKNSAE
ncbi:hypothetical protein LRH25_14740 [Ideonella azotifigens]|uniref:Uncharacterized protein n=1 Tax=Ideonella azotifigens TaxID=513160 RepID=A0ABP3VAF6_9BURK|nr:hypothetical protein [Ideonella azotifigens]MCD2341599.1 hypothetical protein [Ideonella azotifigens]